MGHMKSSLRLLATPSWESVSHLSYVTLTSFKTADASLTALATDSDLIWSARSLTFYHCGVCWYNKTNKTSQWGKPDGMDPLRGIHSISLPLLGCHICIICNCSLTSNSLSSKYCSHCRGTTSLKPSKNALFCSSTPRVKRHCVIKLK